MAKRIRTAFAENGDRTVVQDVPPVDGSVNYDTGYTPQYSLDIVSDPTARRVNRDRFNQLMHDITSNLQEWQNQLYPAYVPASSNGGVAVAYRKGTIVTFSGASRISLVDNNTTQPDNMTNWADAFPLPVGVGGTGAGNATDARANLGIQAATEATAGLARIATQQEVSDGSNAEAYVTPATLSASGSGITEPEADARYARQSNNLSDLDDAVTARTNLGLSSASLGESVQLASAWVNFNGTGTVSIRDSYNVSSITDIGIGNYRVNFLTPMSDDGYATLVTAKRDSDNTFPQTGFNPQTINSVEVVFIDTTPTARDTSAASVVTFGG